MSLYNMVHGFNPAGIFVAPLLGLGHPQRAFPRYRDCFVGMNGKPEYDGKIVVYTRTGGGNREEYEADNNALARHPQYVTDFDDDFDSTFAWFIFDVPPAWKADFDLVVAKRLSETSAAYRTLLAETFPTIKDKIEASFAAPTEPT